MSWSLLGTASYAAGQWAILVVLARMGSPEVVGVFGLATAICTPVAMLANLQLRSVLVTDTGSRFSLRDYVGLRVSSSAAIVLALWAWASCSADRAEYAAVIGALAAAKGIEALADLAHGIFQKHERLDIAARALILRSIASVVGLASVFAITSDLATSMCALASAWALVFVAYELPRLLAVTGRPAAAFLPSFRVRPLVTLAWVALPLGVGRALLALKSSIPAVVVGTELGAAAVGLLAVMNYFGVALATIANAASAAALSRLARHAAEGRRLAFVRLTGKLVGLSAALGAISIVGAAALGEPLLRLLYGDAFAEHHALLTAALLANALGMIVSALAQALTSARAFTAQFALWAGGALVCLAASAWLVPVHGIVGGIEAVAWTHAVQIVVAIALLHRALRRARTEAPWTG